MVLASFATSVEIKSRDVTLSNCPVVVFLQLVKDFPVTESLDVLHSSWKPTFGPYPDVTG